MIFSRIWWASASIRGLRTALILGIPVIPLGQPVTFDNYHEFLLVAGLGFVSSLATSLAGLAEVTGKKVSRWKAILTRMAKSGGQGLVTAIGTSVLLTDVDWNLALQLVISGLVGSFLLGILTALPEVTAPAEGSERDVVEIPQDAQVTTSAVVPVPAEDDPDMGDGSEGVQQE